MRFLSVSGLVRSVLLLLFGLAASGCASQRAVVPEAPPGPPPAPALAPPGAPAADEVVYPAGRFDHGKMWTFDDPPLAYFAEEYDFYPDEAWFEKARLGALRIPNCSASFVSPFGLVMTNHHCAREAVVQVSRPGEDLLKNGFYALSVEEERPVADFYADRLVAIDEVTDAILSRAEGLSGEERAEALQSAIEDTRTGLLDALGGEEAGFEVEIVSLYNGAKYSAYTFRRFDDVRLVLAPELEIGYFGGDPDNFTYPRYSLDVSFFRVFDDGRPLESGVFFAWSADGSRDEEPVFVIGNPGSTSRLQTVAELEFRRDHQEPAFLGWMKSTLVILRTFAEEYPEEAKKIDLTNSIFSIENNVKSSEGTLKGLQDERLMGRRRSAERDFVNAFADRPDEQRRIADLLEETAALQNESAALVPQLMAFFVNPEIDWISSLLHRSVLGFLYSYQRMVGVPAEDLEGLRETILKIKDKPAELERRLLAARLEDMIGHLGASHPTVLEVLNGRMPEEVASELVEQSAAVDSAGFSEMLDGFMEADDPAVEFGRAMAIGYVNYVQAVEPISARSNELAGELGQARYALYGTELPPDATFSLRIADGRVSGYSYNGTLAPPYTTFYGLYDRFYSHGKAPWTIPERWQNPPPTFDLSKPLNLASTNDTVGGNSGSPMVNRDLEVVGLLFDGNIEGLSGDFIYADEEGRAIAVDSRGILEAVDNLYGADRLVLELKAKRFVPSEADADEQMPE